MTTEPGSRPEEKEETSQLRREDGKHTTKHGQKVMQSITTSKY
jgi:hypothetical protein